MKSIQFSHRMYSVDDIKRLLDTKEMVIQPKYQRRRTSWPETAKTSLIDTIINNYPIQPIYLREYVTENRERKKEIIDGQQRVSTIYEFINDEFALSKNVSDETLYGYKFSELAFENQQEILDYEFSFISIRNTTESDIISIFSRLNSFTLPLNAQEKRNAIWSGQFKTLIYKLSSLYSTFWDEFKIFSDKSIARMGEAQFISEVVVTLDVGFQNYSKKKIDDSYKKYDQEFTNFNNYFESFNYVMSILGNLLENNQIRSLFKKQAWFFTLFVAIYEKVFFEPGSNRKNFSAKHLDIERLENSLIEIVNMYNNDGLPADITLLFRQGTGTGSNRRSRHDYLVSLL